MFVCIQTLSVKNLWALYFLTIDKTSKVFLKKNTQIYSTNLNVYIHVCRRVNSRSSGSALLQRKTFELKYIRDIRSKSQTITTWFWRRCIYLHLLLNDMRKHRFREGADGTGVANENKKRERKVHSKGEYALPVASGEGAHYY